MSVRTTVLVIEVGLGTLTFPSALFIATEEGATEDAEEEAEEVERNTGVVLILLEDEEEEEAEGEGTKEEVVAVADFMPGRLEPKILT